MEHILLLIWVGFMALISKSIQCKKTVLVDGVEVERYNTVFTMLCFAPIILMAAFRTFNAGDTWAYSTMFKAMPSSISELPNYLKSTTKDQGFFAFSAIIKILFNDNVVIYFFIIALIQGIIVSNFFRKYSCNFFISLFLFVASIDYFTWMFNGIRQFLAVTIILSAMPLILKKKYIWTILIVLLAATLHQTALIMIPIIFISQGQAWNKKTVAFIIGILAILLFIDSFTPWLDSALSDTQYSNVVKEYTAWKDDGTNPLRVLVYSIPAIISFGARKTIRDSGDKVINLSTNMSIISTGIYLVSMLTSGIFLGRLPIYCSLFSYLLLPWELKHVFNENTRRYITLAMIVLYLGFYYFQMHIIYNVF